MSASPSRLASRLQQFPVFTPVPAEQLHWLAAKAEHLQLKAGDFIFRKGDSIDKMIVILEGKAVLILREGSAGTLDEWESGEITGALPFSRAQTAHAAVQVRENAELLCLPKTFFPEMIREQYELTEVLVHTMTSRVRKFTHNQEQTEKMEALGKLAAGLTHELNNPASAVVRSSSDLKEQLAALPALLHQLSKEGAIGSLFGQLQHLQQDRPEKKAPPSPGLLERSGREEELARWLEERHINKSYSLAQSLTEMQISTTELEELEKSCSKEQLEPCLRCLNLFLHIRHLANDIQLGSSRISNLVNAVKAYTHMDRSLEKERTHIPAGIQNTLTILNFKLRKKNIQVHTHLPDNLPQACVYSGELNQLWTNLLDNAIDAMEPGGILRVSASQEDEWIKVVIEDTGKGIPPEIQQQIYDPFFTTKKAGEGSGMGLDIVRRIVEHHEGKIELESANGRTAFSILLPA